MAEEAATAVMDAGTTEGTAAGATETAPPPASQIPGESEGTPPAAADPGTGTGTATTTPPPESVKVTTGTELGIQPLTREDPGTGAEKGSLLDWRSALSLDIRNDPILAKYNSLEEAGKALVHQGRLLGRSVQVPQTPDAPPEEWQRVWEKMGWPKTPGEYQVKVPEMPEGVPPLTDAFRDRLLIAGHALGLTPPQMQGWLDEAGRLFIEGKQMEAAQEARSKAEGQQEMTRVFGADAPRRLEKARLFFSQTAAGRFGGEYGQRAAEKFIASPLANDPDIVATFADAFDMTNEGNFIESSFVGVGVSREALQGQIAELTAKANDQKLSMTERVRASEARRPLFQQLAAIDEADARRGAARNGR